MASIPKKFLTVVIDSISITKSGASAKGSIRLINAEYDKGTKSFFNKREDKIFEGTFKVPYEYFVKVPELMIDVSGKAIKDAILRLFKELPIIAVPSAPLIRGKDESEVEFKKRVEFRNIVKEKNKKPAFSPFPKKGDVSDQRQGDDESQHPEILQ